jgi:hypothetical protein
VTVTSGQITFTVNPVSEAGAILSNPNPAMINGSGLASVTATANATTGGYTVTASTPAAANATFTLTNTRAPAALLVSQ